MDVRGEDVMDRQLLSARQRYGWCELLLSKPQSDYCLKWIQVSSHFTLYFYSELSRYGQEI